MLSIMYHVGTGYDKNGNKVQAASRKIARAAKYLSALFGGCSVIEASGHWLHNRKLTSEQAKIFEVITDKRQAKARAAAVVLRDMFNQSAVLVTMQTIKSVTI